MITAILLLLLGIVVIALIIAVNGYFVAQEFAFMSVDRAALRARAESGDAPAMRALAVTKRTSFMLSGAQLGITVTGLLVGYVAEPLVGESLGIILGGGSAPTAVTISVGTAIALVVATVVQMIFGELFPKNLAIANPVPLSRWLARSTLIYLAAFGWLIALFDKSSNTILKLLRVDPVHDVDSSATARDLEHIIDDSRGSGDLPEELSILLDRVLDFPNRDVEHAMIPRAHVDIVAPTTTVEEARALMARAHTRYPVVGDREEPIGVVHLADILDADPRDSGPVTAIMRNPLVLPTLMPLPDALEHLMRTRNEFACVIDEYGGFTGVLTIEDLAEELIGEITDEHDSESVVAVERDAEGAWTMGGDIHVDEVERAIGRDLPRGDYETIAGLLIAERGDLPAVGETVHIELPLEGSDLVDDNPMRRVLVVDVIDVDRHVPSEVRVRLIEEPLQPGDRRDASDIAVSGETTAPDASARGPRDGEQR